MAQLALEDREWTGPKYHCTPMPSIKSGTQSVFNNCMVHEWTILLFTGCVQGHPRNTGPTQWFILSIGGGRLAHPD